MCLQDLSLQHITNIMWTYASFLHEVPAMMTAFRQQILQRSQIEQFNAQQLSNLLWSLCIFQVGLACHQMKLSLVVANACICEHLLNLLKLLRMFGCC